MQRLELKSPPKIVIAFEGKDYEVRRPSLKMVRDHENALAGLAKGASPISALIGFLADCGLPASVTENLEADQLEQVSAVLMPAKKN